MTSMPLYSGGGGIPDPLTVDINFLKDAPRVLFSDGIYNNLIGGATIAGDQAAGSLAGDLVLATTERVFMNAPDGVAVLSSGLTSATTGPLMLFSDGVSNVLIGKARFADDLAVGSLTHDLVLASTTRVFMSAPGGVVNYDSTNPNYLVSDGVRNGLIGVNSATAGLAAGSLTGDVVVAGTTRVFMSAPTGVVNYSATNPSTSWADGTRVTLVGTSSATNGLAVGSVAGDLVLASATRVFMSAPGGVVNYDATNPNYLMSDGVRNGLIGTASSAGGLVSGSAAGDLVITTSGPKVYTDKPITSTGAVTGSRIDSGATGVFDNGTRVLSAQNPAWIPVPYFFAGAVTTGLKDPGWFAPVQYNLAFAFAKVSAGSGVVYQIYVNGSAVVTSGSVSTGTNTFDFGDFIVSQGSYVQIGISNAGSSASNLAVTIACHRS